MNEWISTRPYRRNDDRHRFRHICNRPLDFWNAEFRLFAETNATKGHRELFMKEHSTIPLIPIPSESKRVPTSETSVVSYAMAHPLFPGTFVYSIADIQGPAISPWIFGKFMKGSIDFVRILCKYFAGWLLQLGWKECFDES